MAEFKIGEHDYISERLDAFQALHVARRVAPLAATLALSGAGVLSVKDMIVPLMNGISEMKEEDFDYVRNACLGVVRRRVAEGTAQPIFNKSAKMLQFQDISARGVLEIIISVVMENLADFLDAVPSTAADGA